MKTPRRSAETRIEYQSETEDIESSLWCSPFRPNTSGKVWESHNVMAAHTRADTVGIGPYAGDS
jgi:hypothetical protein